MEAWIENMKKTKTILRSTFKPNYEVLQKLASNSLEIEVDNFWDFKYPDIMTFICVSNNLNVQDKYGWTLLMKVVSSSKRYDNEKYILLLLEKNVDLQVRNEDGWTALMIAQKFSKEPRVKNVIKLLENKYLF